MRSLLFVALVAPCSLFVAPAAAETFVLEPGTALASLAEGLKPGDDVLLAPGRHARLALRGVHGTAAQPIVVHGEMQRPGVVAADALGIELIDCSHLVIEDIFVRGATDAAVVISGGASPSGDSIVLRRVKIVGPLPRESLAMADGIRATGGRGLRIEQCRIEQCGGAGIRVASSDDISIVECAVRGSERRSIAGVAIGPAVAGARLSGVRVDAGVSVGVLLGATFEAAPPPTPATPDASPSPAQAPSPPATPGAAAPPAPFTMPPLADASPAPRDIVLDQCVFARCDAAVVLGSASEVLMQRCTAFAPRQTFLRALPAAESMPRAIAALVLKNNLFAWQTNELTRLAELPAGFVPATIRLEANLWWSPDLELDRARYGEFPGTIAAPQQTGIDPRIDRDGRIGNDEAGAFGAG